MFTKLSIETNNIEQLKTNYYKLTIQFYLDSGKYKSVNIEINTEKEVLDIINDLQNLTYWFTDMNLEELITSDLLIKTLENEIFKRENNIKVRFEKSKKNYSVIWIDHSGDACKAIPTK